LCGKWKSTLRKIANFCKYGKKRILQVAQVFTFFAEIIESRTFARKRISANSDPNLNPKAPTSNY